MSTKNTQLSKPKKIIKKKDKKKNKQKTTTTTTTAKRVIAISPTCVSTLLSV